MTAALVWFSPDFLWFFYPYFFSTFSVSPSSICALDSWSILRRLLLLTRYIHLLLLPISGSVWSKARLESSSWEIEAGLRISGRGRLGADGMVGNIKQFFHYWSGWLDEVTLFYVLFASSNLLFLFLFFLSRLTFPLNKFFNFILHVGGWLDRLPCARIIIFCHSFSFCALYVLSSIPLTLKWPLWLTFNDSSKCYADFFPSFSVIAILLLIQ